MNSPPTPTAPTKSLRRSDIKQLRRRLTCSAIRVWQKYTQAQQRINDTFVGVQQMEKALADLNDTTVIGEMSIEEQRGIFTKHLAVLREDAQTLSDLATWYKSGHEQLNSMIAFAEQTIKEMD